MAVYTELSKTFLEELVDDYSFGRISNVVGIPEGSVNTNYLLETAKGKFLVRIDEVKGESEVRREIDLLAFLRKHTFPCPHPMQDRTGRFYRDYDAKCVSIYRYHEGRVVPVMRLPRQIHLRHRDCRQRAMLRRWRLLARPLPLPAARLRVGAYALARRMGRIPQRIALFLVALHGHPSPRLLPEAG